MPSSPAVAKGGPKATYPRVSAGTAAAGQGHRGRGSVARRRDSHKARSVDGQPEVAAAGGAT
jgi:hypothetical protein